MLQTERRYRLKPYLRVTRAAGDWLPFRVVLGWAYRGLTGGFRLLRNFIVAISVSPRVCFILVLKSRKENPQKLTQLSSRSHPRHLVGKRTAQKDITIDNTSDSQVNSNFPNRWSPASLTLKNYFYLFLYLYITWITTNNNDSDFYVSKIKHLWARNLTRKPIN